MSWSSLCPFSFLQAFIKLYSDPASVLGVLDAKTRLSLEELKPPEKMSTINSLSAQLRAGDGPGRRRKEYSSATWTGLDELAHLNKHCSSKQSL